MARPSIALVALPNKNGSDRALESGVHLRWGFRRELGFPLMGFRVFRRESRVPPVSCVWLSKAEVISDYEVRVANEGDVIALTSAEPLRRSAKAVRWGPSDQYAQLGVPVPSPQQMNVIGAEHDVRIALPPTPLALLDILAPERSRITVSAYAEERQVAELSVISRGKGTVIPVVLQADRIDSLKVSAKSLQLVRICHAVREFCNDSTGWGALTKDPICLPVSHPRYPCRHGTGCDEIAAEGRLPKDPCSRVKYGGSSLGDLLEAVRTVVDPSLGPTMASRFMKARVEPGDCPPPGTAAPRFRMPALDLLLTASVDPAIARVLGLYLVDTTAQEGHVYDYKVVGDWPRGTLWSLPRIVGFDDRRSGVALPPGFKHADLTFVADSWCSIVPVPDNFAGARHALQPKADLFDWSPVLPPPTDGERRLFIRFPQTIGEVQVYARQGGGGLSLRAYFDGSQVATAETQSRDAVLAAHARAIDTIELAGDLQYLYQVHYGCDLLPYGLNCYVLYGLRVEPVERIEPPSGVTGRALPGVTRKKNDCQPLLTGGLSDTRYPVGVRWTSPAPPDGTILTRDPLLFHVERKDPDGTSELCTLGRPRMVSRSTADRSPSSLGWPDERFFYTDVVPSPVSYRYRVSGIDIFGRQSEFGPWSRAVAVRPLPPPAPANLTCKWLDPADPFLTTSERWWLSEDNRPGVLVRFEWLDSQARQSPFVEEFHLVFALGWLNHLLGEVQSVPVRDGNTFTVSVAFSQRLGRDVLAGMRMTCQATPCRILKQTPTGDEDPFQTTLRCVTPFSGVPAISAGGIVAMQLQASVRARVEGVGPLSGGTRELTLRVSDLRGQPPGGFTGALLSASGRSWPVLEGAVQSAGSGGATLRVRIATATDNRAGALVNALAAKSVVLQLPPPSPPFVDYRVFDNWRLKAGPIPAEGPGTYEVFVRTKERGEAAGRTSVATRQHRIIVAKQLRGDEPLAYGQAAAASRAQGVTGAVSSAATFVRVSRDRPAPSAPQAPADDLKPVYASLPDYHGHSSYAFRWAAASGMRYAVHRALGETLFNVDQRVGPLRSKLRSDWDWFLGQFPNLDGTLRDTAFAKFIVRATEPEYPALSNRLLQVLASFPDVEEAFVRLNGTPIESNDPAYADRATETAGPDEPAYPPQASALLYVDGSLPARGESRYFYRVRAVDALGNVAPMSASTPPIRLRPARPQTPVITRVTGGDGEVAVAWVVSRDPNIRQYRLYRATSADGVQKLAAADAYASARGTATAVSADEWIHVETVDADPSTRPTEIQCTDTDRPARVDQWYTVVAVRDAAMLSQGTLCSVPSPAIAGRAYDLSVPAAPRWQRSEWVKVDANGVEHAYAVAPATAAVCLEWSGVEASDDVIVERSTPGQLIWAAVAGWQAGLLACRDPAVDASTSYRYRIRVRRVNGNGILGPTADVAGN
jgi:hypothetical protein